MGWRRGLASLALMLAFGCGSALAATETGDLHKTYVFKATGETMPYRLYVPKSYDPKKPVPLLVVLHGAGADENAAFDRSGDLKALADQHGYLVLAPLGYTAFGGYGDIYPIVVTKSTAAAGAGFRAAAASGQARPRRTGPPPQSTTAVPVDDYAEQPASELIDPHAGVLSEQETLAALADVRAAYAVDPARIYLMGNSMGGVGTVYLAAKYPELWAAISPQGGPIAAWSYPYARLKATPTLFVHGEFDEHSNPHWSEVLQKDAVAEGVDARLIVVPHGSHGDAWTRVLPQIFDFFDHHKRTSAAAGR